MTEIVYTIPLLAVIYVNGDAGIVNDEKRSPFTNVSLTLNYEN